ncbi:MAG: hypothetical protein NWF14_06815 [Candidatus Bathyarchaeota archaeon]|nr:hypothetical protein [Candidatus Bathyarchaeota archaeon]
MTSEEVVSGFTAKAFITGLLGCIFTAFVMYERSVEKIVFQKPRADYWAGGSQSAISITGAIFGLIAILALINHGAERGWWKFRFSRQEVGMVVILMTMGAFFYATGFAEYWRDQFSENVYPILNKPETEWAEWWAMAPDTGIFGPKTAEPWLPIYTEGVKTLTIDWAAFMPTIVIAIAWFLCPMMFFFFGSLLLRRLWLRVEYLPAPYTELVTSYIDMTQPATSSKSKVKLFSNKLFIVVFLITFIYHFALRGSDTWIQLLTGAAPAQPWYGEYLGTGAGMGYFDLSLNCWLPWTGLYINLGAMDIGWALLLPTNVIISALIAWFAMHFVFPFTYMATYWGPFTPAIAGSADSASEIVLMKWSHDDLGFSLPAILVGCLFAIAIAPIVMNWGQMAPIFKGLFKEPENEFDPDRPLSYRLTWILTIAFFILWLIVGITFYVLPVGVMLGFSILISVAFFGAARVVMETGGWYTSTGGGPYFEWPQVVGVMSNAYFTQIGDNIPSRMAVYMFGARTNSFIANRQVPLYSLHAFKLGENIKTHMSGILKVLVIGGVVVLLTTAYVNFFDRGMTTYLWKARGEYFKEAIPKAADGIPGFKLQQVWTDTPNESFMQIAFGFVLIFALSILQPRIAIMRSLSIGGVVWGFMGMHVMWTSWLVALVIKFAVLRTGGTKMYEQILKPIGLALVAGVMLATFSVHLGSWFYLLVYGT